MTNDPALSTKLAKLTAISHRKPYQAFLYDCDGTLADNMHAHKAAYRRAAEQYGIDLDTTIIDELAGWPTVLIAEEIKQTVRNSCSCTGIRHRQIESFPGNNTSRIPSRLNSSSSTCSIISGNYTSASSQAAAGKP